MARLLTVVVSTRQLPPARLTTGPLLGTTAYHPGFLFTTVAGHGHSLRTGGTGSYIMFNNLSSYTCMSMNEDSNTSKVKSKAMIHSYIKIIKTNVRLACNDEPFFLFITWDTHLDDTGADRCVHIQASGFFHTSAHRSGAQAKGQTLGLLLFHRSRCIL